MQCSRSASAEPSPRPAERKRSLDAPAAAPGPRLRCLVADDHGLNRLLVAKLASQHGFDVATAVDGADALAQLVAAFVAGAPPHIALIDVQARCQSTWQPAEIAADAQVLRRCL